MNHLVEVLVFKTTIKRFCVELNVTIEKTKIISKTNLKFCVVIKEMYTLENKTWPVITLFCFSFLVQFSVYYFFFFLLRLIHYDEVTSWSYNRPKI